METVDRKNVFAYGNRLVEAVCTEQRTLQTFTSHWAACAAMVRLRQPEFVSLGGDRPADLDAEAEMRARFRFV